MPKISILIPVHDVEGADFFLWRNINSILSQTFKDYEIVISKEPGGIGHNTNEGIKRCRGDIIKILYLDDFFAHDEALQDIVTGFGLKYQWLVTGCTHLKNGCVRRLNPHLPKYSHDIYLGNNTIGSPSVLAFRRATALMFDEEFMWMIDCDFYKRCFDAYGEPRLLNDINVVIGVGEHQTTYTMPEELKAREVEIMKQRYV